MSLLSTQPISSPLISQDQNHQNIKVSLQILSSWNTVDLAAEMKNDIPFCFVVLWAVLSNYSQGYYVIHHTFSPFYSSVKVDFWHVVVVSLVSYLSYSNLLENQYHLPRYQQASFFFFSFGLISLFTWEFYLLSKAMIYKKAFAALNDADHRFLCCSLSERSFPTFCPCRSVKLYLRSTSHSSHTTLYSCILWSTLAVQWGEIAKAFHTSFTYKKLSRKIW